MMRIAGAFGITLALFVLAGCASGREKGLRREITALTAQVRRLEAAAELHKLEDEKRAPSAKEAGASGETAAPQGAPEPARAEEVYPWLRKENCDKIVITRPGAGQVEITDPAVTKLMPVWLLVFEETDPGSPPVPDVPGYTYTFFWGKERHTVEIAARGLAEIEGRYFVCDIDAHNLGNAFLPAPRYMRTDYLEAKIAQSGMVVGEPGSGLIPCFDSGRILCFAEALCEAERLPSPPANPGEVEFTLTFYRFGEKILMHCYDKHIEVVEDGKSRWYRHDEAKLLYTILTAG